MRSPLLGLGLLVLLAFGLACYHYATGNDQTFPLLPVPQLKPVPLVLHQVQVGLAALPMRVNGYLITQTYDMAGPYVRPEAAAALLVLVAIALAYALAAISTLARPAFVAGMAFVIFLLMSFNADLLGIFDAQKQYFLMLALLALGVPAYTFHAFWTDVPLWQRILLFAGLLAGLSALLFLRSDYPANTTALHLASYATTSGAIAVGLLILWVAFENIHGLLWFNTQAENASSRFGLLPFLLASGLYLGILLMYYLNDGELLILPGVHLDPYILLLPAMVIGWFGLQRRATSYGEWLPYAPGARYIYLTFCVLALGFLGYAFATANDPLLTAGRDFVALAFLTCGGAFLLYILINFAQLIRQRLRVYRVVYNPRRFPLYVVYLLGIASIIAVQARNNFFLRDQVQAGYFNNLGDLTRLQSEQQPTVDALALLAERYYAESDVLDRFNHKASLGRAALYHFRAQRQNEINALRRALSRRPSEKISLRLASLYNEPNDFFDRLQVLRQGLKSAPKSAALANDMAQLYTRSTITDSVEFYLHRAEALAPENPVIRANRIAFLVQQQQLAEAQKLTEETKSPDSQPVIQSNALLLAQLTGKPAPKVKVLASDQDLTLPEFSRLYHDALRRAVAHDTTLLPALTKLVKRQGNSAYFDQLTFLVALTQQYGDRPVTAQAALLPLTTGNSPGVAYYQHLQGLWLLEEGANASAAARFTEAATNGYADAHLPRAYALALSNQPDSARVAAVRATRIPDASQAQAARQLVQALQLRYPTDFGQATDSVRAQYFVLRGAELPPSEQLSAPKAIRAAPALQVAMLAQARRALVSNQLADVQAVIEEFAPQATTKSPQTSEWNILRGNLLVRGKQLAALQQIARTAYFEPLHQPYRLYYRAVAAELSNNPTQAAQLYQQLANQAPYVEEGVLAAANFYAQRRDYAAAYDVLLRSLEYNADSPQLLKGYALAAIPAGLTEYAEASLEKLRSLLSPPEYATFRSQYDARRAAQAAATAPWN
ncbi:hypothetical protein [Hymenobacter jejuensis]|uniref:Tetratricopeptide repeat protein n=1 Tax=Hymenobacter jejuensis TaxID=2502781 RepID=A0A5B8A4K5_9BACT|nr:hypothetical protein [Hymenobacter jejuensis]QDA61082.1 hypothetical protein FHG12_13640 [Hymenobacter jejuensis]